MVGSLSLSLVSLKSCGTGIPTLTNHNANPNCNLTNRDDNCKTTNLTSI